MGGLGQFLYNTGTDKNGSAHNQIRITIQGADEKKEEEDEAFHFHECLERNCESNVFEQTNFLPRLICVHLCLARPYIHCLARCSYR